MWISHLDRELLRPTRACFVVLLIEATKFYRNNHTKSAAFHAPSFYLFGEQSLRKMYELHEAFNKLLKASLLGFLNEKFVTVPGRRRSIKYLYLNCIRLFKFDPKDKKKREVEKVEAGENRPVSCIRKEIEEIGEQVCSIRCRITANVILRSRPTRTSR